ncbi:hypothetical protein TRFO_07414 [Tritrichomonas foetus]|uniref:Uncharacterized protein n=1 Tax=Tritrichomonas foetus TaxID=1144522 RepID=A0A1J4JTS2_9EUKA|nr:hypothetical protein TRFO_07414 [Tritrichomonas foetus]|eukprot:OHT01840.1 hypothetical protein TRFO_07414 [Tritrichomonas foetus]
MQITLVTPNPGQDFDTNSPQCQALVSNLDSQLKEQIAKLVEENNQLKQKVQRQAEQFREISALADQLINPSA